MIITVSSTSALISALKAAQAGDTVQLAPGVYSSVAISGLNFAQDVIVTSADPANAAVLTGLSVSRSSGLTFQDLEFVVNPANGSNPFKVTGSQDIHFKRLDVHGSLDGNPQNDGGAFMIRTSTDVSVEDSEFHELAIGIGHLDNNHLLISNNEFHHIMMDGVRGGGSSWVTITGNDFSDFYREEGVHPDAIQFWTSNTTVATHDITITNNTFQRGDGGPAQGIFLGNEAKIPYENITITGNAIIGGMYNGISIAFGNKVVISDNLVLGYTDMASKIRVDDSRNVTISDNTTSHFVLQRNGEGIVQTGNTITSNLPIGDTKTLEAWQVDHSLPGDSSAQDLPNVSVTLTGGAGADTLASGGAADTLDGGAGADVLSGGGGDDFYVTDGKDTIVELVDGGFDTIRSAVSLTLPNNVEKIVLVGTAIAGKGNDLDNVLVGNAIGNQLYGRAGNDTISGEGGADTLLGAAGNDDLTGGAGVDVFRFAQGDGSDVIRDFGAGGEHDVIDVSAFYAAGLQATLSATSASGVRISFASGESILVEGVSLGDLHATATGWVF